MQDRVQKFGKALSSMVMPNIGAFIAWGFITAFFIATGWWPNEKLALLIEPMLKYLLPLLIAYSGGKNVAGTRGGVIGAIATIGVIVGSDIPMFIGAMAMGPFAAWVIRKFDKATEGKIPAGFEMLVNNFSLGILGMCCAIVGFYAVGPIVTLLTGLLGEGVQFIMNKGLLPLVSVFIEPGKVLFLNNAINHGILTPLGLEQSQQTGKSIMFLLEANPGPGFGVLLAYWIFSKGSARNSAPSAVIIHLFGGIHEIYFPYILMRPVLIIAPILGSASAILVYSLLGGGIVAPASPGSIIAVMAMAPKGQMLIVLLGIAVAATVSFLVASPIIKSTTPKKEKEVTETNVPLREKINHIVFACDAGMGSSAMGSTRFRNRIRMLDVALKVDNSPVDKIPEGAYIVVCQHVMASRAQKSAPFAELVVIDDFLNHPNLDKLFERVKTMVKPNSGTTGVENQILSEKKQNAVLLPENILTGLKSTTKEAAIMQAGKLLIQGGYVEEGYDTAMLEREQLTTTYLGMGIAIPHGTSEAKDKVLKSGIVVLQYPSGIWFDKEKAFLVIGIAGVGDEHIDILSRLTDSLDNEQVLHQLKVTTDRNYIMEILG